LQTDEIRLVIAVHRAGSAGQFVFTEQNLSSAVVTANTGIEIEKADEIRFRISQKIWQNGCNLAAWSAAVKEAIVRAQSAGD
jgi:hypothetical protein